jgi:hypothetical protein|nr:MAG TPA: hypothetical protein [Caudoviricetes sp.]
MKLIIALLIASIPACATADCWIVNDMKGVSYSARNDYKLETDSFSGTFKIKIDADNSSVTYSGEDAGGVSYKPFSSTHLIGFGTDGNGGTMSESWSIQPNGVVIMSKIISGYGQFDSTKAMTGKVSGKC